MDALGAEVAQRVLADMGRALRIETPTITLACKYVGTEEEDAPLNGISRVKYEWALADFGVLTIVVQAGKSLHSKLSVPTELKIPLLCV